MFRPQRILTPIVFLIVFSSIPSQAALKIETLSDGILVYSGPSRRFRPLMRVRKGRKFAASSTIVQGKDGDFYRVLVVSARSKRKRIGYIFVDEPVSIIGESKETEEELTEIRSFAQAESSLQLSTWFLKDSLYIWGVGYQKYFAPEFYTKAFIGQLFNKVSGSLTTGVEMGMDQSFSGQFSLFTSFAFGVVVVGQEDVLFPDSKELNYLVVGTGGLRFHADQYASVSLGFGQTAIINHNNSYTSPTVGFSVEVGL